MKSLVIAIATLSVHVGASRLQGQKATVDLIPWTLHSTTVQWFTTIQVGTPPQNFAVIIDTGSTDLLIPRSNCTTCGHHSLFDPSSSSTFSPSPGVEVSYGFSTGYDSAPLPAVQKATGLVVADTVRLGGLTVPSQRFVLADVYEGFLAQGPIDGILGVGLPNATSIGALPFFWSLYDEGSLASPVFAFSLADTPELTLGGVDESKLTGMTVVDLDKELNEDFGTVVVEQPYVSVDGVEMPFPPGLALLDTGTAFVQSPSYEVTRDLYARISPEIHPLDENGSWGAPCAVLGAVAPETKFTLEGRGGKRFDAVIPRRSFNLGPPHNGSDVCQALFVHRVQPIPDPQGRGRPVWIVGSPLLRQYYTMWDGLNLQLGFAPLP